MTEKLVHRLVTKEEFTILTNCPFRDDSYVIGMQLGIGREFYVYPILGREKDGPKEFSDGVVVLALYAGPRQLTYPVHIFPCQDEKTRPQAWKDAMDFVTALVVADISSDQGVPNPMEESTK